MLFPGFTTGSLNLLTSILSIAPSFLQFSKEQSSITPLNSAQIKSFKPYTFFASAAYCHPSKTLNWTCGAHCTANWDFIPVNAGGDGGTVQFWYVGYSPSLATVIVAHQGTDTSRIEADATDADLFFETLDDTFFPGISSSIETHSGFANEQAKTAREVLAAVQIAIVENNATQVTTVGHSLGAAIALLDVMYLPLHIKGVSFKMIGYGMPRVGNHAFADYVDANLNVTHINNKKDFVPIIPGRDLRYHHPSGEIHITEDDQWVHCPGQDNPSKKCSVGDVPDVFYGKTANHGGPYDKVVMGVGC